MMKLTKLGLAATVAAGVAGTLLSVVPASAATNPWTISTTGAQVKFWADGDVFRLYDTKADGQAVHMFWEMQDGSGLAGSGDNSDGNGTNKKFASVNLPDNHSIEICVWRTNDSVETCGITST